MAQHRSPVIPAGKENLMLPPIDSARGRGPMGSASRHNPAEGLRNNGAAIMGHQHSSAKNLNRGSENGSDGGVRNS